MQYLLSPRWPSFQRLAAPHSLILNSSGRERRTNASARGVANYYTRCGFVINATHSDRCAEYRSAKLGDGGNYCHFTQFPTTEKEGDAHSGTEKTSFFHVSPSGDWWTGPSIFAAKHLQPDYVRSIPIPPGFDPNEFFGDDNDDDDGGAYANSSRFSEMSWEQKQELLHRIYDEGEFPSEMLIDCNLVGFNDDGTSLNKT
mmetsp:Transcript_5487/g.11213  ORF Transcript_5487/g.11213 Transcript_5487/m.11213 type:complete len:200 (-) Transcript_5487:32-631(-)